MALTKKEIDLLRLVAKQCNKSPAFWTVISALRGPDSEDFVFKLGTTALIRGAIGINTPNLVHTYHDLEAAVKTRAELPWGHFREHVAGAFECLGLSWGAPNEGVSKTLTKLRRKAR